MNASGNEKGRAILRSINDDNRYLYGGPGYSQEALSLRSNFGTITLNLNRCLHVLKSLVVHFA